MLLPLKKQILHTGFWAILFCGCVVSFGGHGGGIAWMFIFISVPAVSLDLLHSLLLWKWPNIYYGEFLCLFVPVYSTCAILLASLINRVNAYMLFSAVSGISLLVYFVAYLIYKSEYRIISTASAIPFFYTTYNWISLYGKWRKAQKVVSVKEL